MLPRYRNLKLNPILTPASMSSKFELETLLGN